MTVNVKFMVLNEKAEVATGVVMDCPSIAALEEKFNEMNVLIVHMAEATDEEVALAKRSTEGE